jgi:hypothetical protein
MKTFIIVLAAGAFAIIAFLGTPVEAANVPAWCANSGYDNGPRERPWNRTLLVG